MNTNDFNTCEFIADYLQFVTYFDFCDNCKAIKSAYNRLSNKEKRFYKWYVYANIFIDESRKNTIWNYLNQLDDEKYYDELISKIRNYKIR